MRSFVVLVLGFWLTLLPVQAVETITRGEFVRLLWEKNGGVPFDKTAHPFTDLTDDDTAQAAAWAYHEGLTFGVGGALFAPERPLTREECALLLRRDDLRLSRQDWLGDGAAACNDWEEVSPWSDDSLYRACVSGRLPWKEGTLAPTEPVSRTDALAALSYH